MIEKLGMKVEDVFEEEGNYGLWNAKLFPVCNSAEESSTLSLEILRILNGETPAISWKSKPRASLR